MAKTAKQSLANVFSRAVASVRPKAASETESFWCPGDHIYPRLLELDFAAHGLEGKSGIFALWHLGVRPQWLKIGGSHTLGEALSAYSRHEDILSYDRNRGVFVAWAYSHPENWEGQINFLAEHLKPSLQALRTTSEIDVGEKTEPLLCPLPPGTEEPSA